MSLFRADLFRSSAEPACTTLWLRPGTAMVGRKSADFNLLANSFSRKQAEVDTSNAGTIVVRPLGSAATHLCTPTYEKEVWREIVGAETLNLMEIAAIPFNEASKHGLQELDQSLVPTTLLIGFGRVASGTRPSAVLRLIRVDYRLCYLCGPAGRKELPRLQRRCLEEGVTIESQWKPNLSQGIVWSQSLTKDAAPPKLLTCLVEGRPVVAESFIDTLARASRSKSTAPPSPLDALEDLMIESPRRGIHLASDPGRQNLLRGEIVFSLVALDQQKRTLLSTLGCKQLCLLNATEPAFAEMRGHAARRIAALQILRDSSAEADSGARAAGERVGDEVKDGSRGDQVLSASGILPAEVLERDPNLRQLTREHGGVIVMIPQQPVDPSLAGIGLARDRATLLSKMGIPVCRESAIAQCVARSRRLGTQLRLMQEARRRRQVAMQASKGALQGDMDGETGLPTSGGSRSKGTSSSATSAKSASGGGSESQSIPADSQLQSLALFSGASALASDTDSQTGSRQSASLRMGTATGSIEGALGETSEDVEAGGNTGASAPAYQATELLRQSTGRSESTVTGTATGACTDTKLLRNSSDEEAAAEQKEADVELAESGMQHDDASEPLENVSAAVADATDFKGKVLRQQAEKESKGSSLNGDRNDYQDRVTTTDAGDDDEEEDEDLVVVASTATAKRRADITEASAAKSSLKVKANSQTNTIIGNTSTDPHEVVYSRDAEAAVGRKRKRDCTSRDVRAAASKGGTMEERTTARKRSTAGEGDGSAMAESESASDDEVEGGWEQARGADKRGGDRMVLLDDFIAAAQQEADEKAAAGEKRQIAADAEQDLLDKASGGAQSLRRRNKAAAHKVVLDDDMLGFYDSDPDEDATEEGRVRAGEDVSHYDGTLVAADPSMLVEAGTAQREVGTSLDSSGIAHNATVVEIPASVSILMAPRPPTGMEAYYWGTGRIRPGLQSTETIDRETEADFPVGGLPVLRWTRTGALLSDGSRNYKAFTPSGAALGAPDMDAAYEQAVAAPVIAIVTKASGAIEDATEYLEAQASRKRRRVSAQSRLVASETTIGTGTGRGTGKAAGTGHNAVAGARTKAKRPLMVDDDDDDDDMEGELVAAPDDGDHEELDAIEGEEDAEADDLFGGNFDAAGGKRGTTKSTARSKASSRLLGTGSASGQGLGRLFAAGSPKRYLKKGRTTNSVGGDALAAMDAAAKDTTVPTLQDSEEDEDDEDELRHGGVAGFGVDGEDDEEDETMVVRGSATNAAQQSDGMEVGDDEDMILQMGNSSRKTQQRRFLAEEADADDDEFEQAPENKKKKPRVRGKQSTLFGALRGAGVAAMDARAPSVSARRGVSKVRRKR